MKTKKSFGTHVLSNRLLWEGLKRLRVLGLGILILVLAISVSVPVVDWMERSKYSDQPPLDKSVYFDREEYDGKDLKDYVAEESPDSYYDYPYRYSTGNVVRYANLNTSLTLLPLTAPLFVLVLFSFLFSRNESDFYHSLPYTRRCLFLSFTTAIVIWLAGITLIAGLTSGILWGLHPYRILILKDLLALSLSSFLSSLLLASFMLLAISLCGNSITTLINFAVFVILPRMSLCLLGSALQNTLPGIQQEYFMGGFFSTDWCLPLYHLVQGAAPDTGVLIYSAVILLPLLILAGLAFSRRSSQTAGNTVVDRGLHIFFRCLFTMPFALYFTFSVLSNGVNHTDGSQVYIWIVVVLVAYFLYELITTKRPRNLIRAIPHLLLVVGVCLVFVLAFFGIRTAVLYEVPKAERIESVRIRGGALALGLSGSYETQMFAETDLDDPELIEQVAKIYERNHLCAHTIYVWEKNLRSPTDSDHLIELRISLKGGRTMHRRLYVSEKDLQELSRTLRKIPELQTLDDHLPPLAFVNYCSVSSSDFYAKYHNLTHKALIEFYTILEGEYAALTDEQRDHLQAEHGTGYYLELNGYTPVEEYYYAMQLNILPDLTPKSYAWLTAFIQEQEGAKYIGLEEKW